MKWMRDGVMWGEYPYKDGVDYAYYFFWWNWLPPESRYWGREDFYYDQPHRSFGFWFFNWSWSTQWTPYP